MRILCVLACVFFAACADAKIEQYFKKPANKTGHHQMRNIDFIYTLNLDQRPEKFESCTKQLHPYGIYPYRFSAVNGWELSLELIHDVGVKFVPGMKGEFWGTSYFLNGNFEPQHEIIQNYDQVYFCHCMGRGPIGIVLSHLSILQDAYDSGYETIWVMEDDIEVLQNPHLLSDSIEKLDWHVGKSNWDILFTDQDTRNQNGEYVSCLGYALRPNFQPANPMKYSQRRQIGQEFKAIGARYGAYSMIVRRSGMKKILDFIKTHQIFLPYDMDFWLPADMRMFTVINDIVTTQARALSDNGGPNYLNK